jgi:hypothetical protein
MMITFFMEISPKTVTQNVGSDPKGALDGVAIVGVGATVLLGWAFLDSDSFFGCIGLIVKIAVVIGLVALLLVGFGLLFR